MASPMISLPATNRISRILGRSRMMSFRSKTAPDSLFGYTSGRWLWNEREQMEARYRRFSVPDLQQVACHAIGAERCISLEKIGEGNYNKAYRLTMGNGRKVIAKLPHPNAGPPGVTTASEVATMEFVRTVLHIPVPKILTWSASRQNTVGAEYIIMDEAKGFRLNEVWQDLKIRARCDVVSKIVEIESKLLSVSFDRIGSLYFRDSQIPGCSSLGGTIGTQKFAEETISEFCIGPIARREFWQAERSTMSQHHGPWASATEYLEAVIDRESDWIKFYANSREAATHLWKYTSPNQDCPEAHLASLRKLRSAIPLIVPQDADIVSSRMWHPDFHAGNVFLDASGKISSIIDWQGAWTTPLFIGANPPAMLDYGVEMLMKLPDNFKDLDDATKDRLRYQVSQSILIHNYETLTAAKNPSMYKMMRHPHGQTLKQLEAFAGATWDNHLFPLQECLVRIEREWEYFGSQQACPYHFTEDEIRKHDEEAESFNESQSFWDNMRGILTDEGYTTNETFDTAVDALLELRTIGLARSEGSEKDAFDRDTRWILELSTQAIASESIGT